MQIKTQIAKNSDAEILSRIGAKTFLETYSGKADKVNIRNYIKKSFTGEKLKNDLDNEKSIFLIAFKNTKAVGYAKLNKNKSIEIERMYVLKKVIGKKVGKSLMEKCLKITKKQNYNKIWLGVWEQNEHAISFYKKWGFKTFGSHVFALGKEKHKDILMEKML